MKVLAVDPGYERCGVSVVEKRDRKEYVLYSDCLQTSASLPLYERFMSIGNGIERLLEKHKPDAVAIENIYFNKNQKTAIAVAQVRGIIMYVSAVRGVPIHEYTPGEIKSAVAGWGKADKKQVIDMVPKLVSIEKNIRYDDEYDAIAIGLTCLAYIG